MNEHALRALCAGATVLAYASLCAGVFLRERRRTRQRAERAASLAGSGHGKPTLVLFGSQTGQAESIAWQTAGWLKARGEATRVCSLNETSLADLQSAPRALFIASTYGEGDAPDGASVFAERVMTAERTALPNLHFSVLALGDRQYAHFCGFGRLLNDWLLGTGAQREHECVEADNADPAAMKAWRLHVGGAAHAEPTLDQQPGLSSWRLLAREQVNLGSQGTPLFHLAFAPAQSDAPTWQAGDLVQLEVPSDRTRPRDYSIASIPQDGELHLLVRQERHPDGSLGAASGLLTQTLPVGSSLALRVRSHSNFQLGFNAQRPLILIGNGSGLAGLRALLRERERLGKFENWLVYGERNAQWDRPYRAELERWQQQGLIERLDLVFSRDHAERMYVQHRLLQASDAVLAWLERGAAIYVCGSLQGMGSGVDAALRQIAGDERTRELVVQGRYRRDVY
mgnify:CR=1 FL=1